MFSDPRNVGRTVSWFPERSTWSILLNIFQTSCGIEWSFDLLTSIHVVFAKYGRNSNVWILLAEKLRWKLPLRGGGSFGSGSTSGKYRQVPGGHVTDKLKLDGRLIHVQFSGQLCDSSQTNFSRGTVTTCKHN